MDITDALAPKSDQLDAIELVAPRTFTIDTGSKLGTRDDDGQAVVEVNLVDFPRVWRPSKGMLDAIVAIWGTNAKEWAGHQVTLYNDPEVTFGRDKVGGIRISHMSGIDKTRQVQIRGRGRGARKLPWRIEPIATTPAPAPEPSEADVAACTDTEQLRAMWQRSGDERRAQIQARVNELAAPVAQPDAAPDDADTDPGAPWGEGESA